MAKTRLGVGGSSAAYAGFAPKTEVEIVSMNLGVTAVQSLEPERYTVALNQRVVRPLSPEG